MSQKTATPSRRFNSRIALRQDVWVCWQCNGRDDVSRVRDLSLGGLFLETRSPRAIASPTKADFLWGEGQIRADAWSRHVGTGRAWGLKSPGRCHQDPRKLSGL